jgi:hypothetical protein
MSGTVDVTASRHTYVASIAWVMLHALVIAALFCRLCC